MIFTYLHCGYLLINMLSDRFLYHISLLALTVNLLSPQNKRLFAAGTLEKYITVQREDLYPQV